MARGGKAKADDAPLDLSRWPTLNERARRLVVESLRPALRDVATQLGARTAEERGTVLEVVGITALVESGKDLVYMRAEAPKQDADLLGRFL